MSKEIFRKKNVEKVNSPEDLNSYLRITNPSIIISLSAVAILLVGAVIWGCVAKIEKKAKGVAATDSSGTACYINATEIGSVTENSTVVRVNNVEYKVTYIEKDPFLASLLDDDVRILGGFGKDDYIYQLSVDKPISVGYFSCEYVLKTYTPFEFLFKQ